jgi:predicted alpha/beta superfamily hydrolase
MKKSNKIFSLSLSLMLLVSCSKEVNEINSENPEFNTFNTLKITDIHPEGWIKEFLVRQKEGLTGNIEVAGYPYDTKMWATEKIKGSTKAWWPYEQTGYYIDGANRLGYLLNDPSLKEKTRIQKQYVLDHINPETGRVSTVLEDRWKRWPYAGFFRNYMTDYSVTKDKSIVEALHKHYLTFSAQDFTDDLELANVEELCWLYGITKDKKLLDMAEEAYHLFKSDIENRNRAGADIQFGVDRNPDHHVVVYLELVKIPAILYSHTGNEDYLNEALNGIKKAEKYNMLASGLPSSTEHFAGISELSGTETCNAAVFPHTYGYMLRITGNAELGDKIEKAIFNAGIGSITKDFKAHQYFSAPNQFLATLNSNNYGHHPSRMAYVPGHDVECCTGNVNRFMPYYVEQMWLSSPDNGLVASLFGPTSVSTTVGKNQIPITVTENTSYPFSDTIEFKFQMEDSVEFPLYIRIPKWSTNTKIAINGKVINEEITSGSFFKLKRTFSNNDVITLTVPMETSITNWPNNGISIERGPLVYSLSIDETTNIISDYERATEEFPAIERRPNSNWNYALNLFENENSNIEIIKTHTTGYPWDIGNSPIKIRVPVKKVKNWKLKEVVGDKTNTSFLTTPEFPEELETEDKTEYIDLVPYGATQLRLTVFPEVKVKFPKVNDGKIERISMMKSKYISARNIDVWLPSDYDTSKRYSVLYMNDGQVLFDPSLSWLNDEWQVDEMMGKLLKEKSIENTIIVGVFNSGLGRVDDYFPQKPFESLPQKYVDSMRIELDKVEYTKSMMINVHSDNYLKFLVEELKPFIDERYSTLPDKEHTYIMGSSYGGLISMYAISEYPDVFQGAACLSTHWIGSFTDNPTIAQAFIDYFGDNIPNSKNHKIYFDYGTETLDQYYEPYQFKIDSIMKLNSYTESNWKTLKFEGKNHSEASWRERLDIPLTFLLRNE